MILNELAGLVRVYLFENWQLAVPVLAVTIAIATYTITSIAYFFAVRSTKDGRLPPTVPYWLPAFGSTIPFLADIEKFVNHVKYVRYRPLYRAHPLGGILTETQDKVWRRQAIRHQVARADESFHREPGGLQPHLAVDKVHVQQATDGRTDGKCVWHAETRHELVVPSSSVALVV